VIAYVVRSGSCPARSVPRLSNHPTNAELPSRSTTIVDNTNPVNLETFDSLLPPPESSSAAELAAALPSSHVLKAFNTTFAGTLSARQVGPITTTVLVAADDADAKAALMEAVKGGGVEAIDVGGITVPANLRRSASCKSSSPRASKSAGRAVSASYAEQIDLTQPGDARPVIMTDDAA
jgi:predicted dinucleotide-binding enzyme